MKKTNTKIENGTKVEAYTSYCPALIIFSTTYEGTITKVNKKSFIVSFEKFITRKGSTIETEGTCTANVKFTFWKETSDGRKIYKSEGRIYGIITF